MPHSPSTRPTAPAAFRLTVRPWHAVTAEEALEALGTPPDGLSTDEAAVRLAEFGPNQLAARSGPPAWLVFLRQFKSPLIYVLLGAAGVSFLVGKRFDVVVILGIVLLNAVLGFIQEARAASAIAALQKLTSPHAHVLRDGEVREVLATAVVPGDLLILEAGDRVAADARVLKASELMIDEAALTGESLPVSKHPQAIAGGGDVPLGDRLNMAYMNSVVTAGRGRTLVVATGMATEMGRIAQELAEGPSEPPVQRKLASFSRRLGAIIGVIITGVLVTGLLLGHGFLDMFYMAISLAVSAIPEGLPIVVSVLFAVGVNRMARRNALVRRLPAVEALGSATVICSDKTGTLTRNEMTVRKVQVGDRLLDVEGEGYRPVGRLTWQGEPVSVRGDEGLYWLGACARLCNDALLVEKEGEWQILGDPTEGALTVLTEKIGLKPDWERLEELPFSSERKWMATLNLTPEGERVGFIKGAVDRLVPMAQRWLDAEGREHAADAAFRARVEAQSGLMASEALRVLALGMVRDVSHAGAFSPDLFEGGLTYLGLVGMIDPERPEAVTAIRTCRDAGIRVVMITGDHLATGLAIARRLGITQDGSEAIDGPRLAILSDRELTEAARRLTVYARVSPEHKLRIVRSLKAEGEIVAMTGDGVNDAPALSQADIGVSMGITGTEVAKGAADMVLADDNFATIVAAVEEGRTIASNLHKVLHYLITTTICAVLVITAAMLLNLPLPLVAVQIIWINLVTDGIFDKTLALERPEPGLMQRPPAQSNAPLVSRQDFGRMALLGSVSAIGTLASYAWELAHGATLTHARTEAFTTMVAFQWFSAFAYRSERVPLWRLPVNVW
ncbi:MAG TPA: HAD-IC family P-type ATPase, partial [Stenomitos sp.]